LKVELFPWEKDNLVDEFRKIFEIWYEIKINNIYWSSS
jgi:hypothetical protein